MGIAGIFLNYSTQKPYYHLRRVRRTVWCMVSVNDAADYLNIRKVLTTLKLSKYVCASRVLRQN